MNLINLFITSLLTENIVLTKFLGICPFIGTSNSRKNAIGMGLSTMLVVTLSSIITYLIYYYILVPTNTVYLKTVMFILVIASFVQILVLIMKKYFKRLYDALGLYLPLITTNCAVLGITLINISSEYTFLQMLCYSIGSSLGFVVVIYIFSTIREYLDTRNIPSCFKGYPISFIVAAIMCLVFARLV